MITCAENRGWPGDVLVHNLAAAGLPAPSVILADPDNDEVIACAIAARADLIVSGDRHLRDTQSHQGIRIVSSGEALQLITQ